MAQTTALAYKLKEMAGRIKELREIENLTLEEMAEKTGVSVQEYAQCEAGESDLNFAFLYRCALALNVDVTDIIEGSSPMLSSYTITRKGQGQRIEQAHGMVYYNLAAQFKNRVSEPLYVDAIYTPGAEYSDIELTSHAGQELDIIISGKLKVQVGEHTAILEPGDSIYYDSSTPHGMVAVDGDNCRFYAIVLDPQPGTPIETIMHGTPIVPPHHMPAEKKDDVPHIWSDFIEPVEDDEGTLQSISFKNTEIGRASCRE